jgi:hypothetical protein
VTESFFTNYQDFAGIPVVSRRFSAMAELNTWMRLLFLLLLETFRRSGFAAGWGVAGWIVWAETISAL